LRLRENVAKFGWAFFPVHWLVMACTFWIKTRSTKLGRNLWGKSFISPQMGMLGFNFTLSKQTFKEVLCKMRCVCFVFGLVVFLPWEDEFFLLCYLLLSLP